MKSFEGPQDGVVPEEQFSQDYFESRSQRAREIEDVTRAGMGERCAALGRKAKDVVNLLFSVYKELIVLEAKKSSRDTPKRVVQDAEFLNSLALNRKEELKERYESILATLENSGLVTTVKGLRQLLDEAEEGYQASRKARGQGKD